MMSVAKSISYLSTCKRKDVGCVTLSEDGRILSTGYNGVARGLPHCSVKSCDMPENQSCYAIHAEMNALAHVEDVMSIHSVYCTLSPCWECAKMLLNTGMKELYYAETYRDSSPIEFLRKQGIAVEKLNVKVDCYVIQEKSSAGKPN